MRAPTCAFCRPEFSRALHNTTGSYYVRKGVSALGEAYTYPLCSWRHLWNLGSRPATDLAGRSAQDVEHDRPAATVVRLRARSADALALGYIFRSSCANSGASPLKNMPQCHCSDNCGARSDYRRIAFRDSQLPKNCPSCTMMIMMTTVMYIAW